jgi:hypothetical protein
VLSAFPLESWLATTPSAFDLKEFRSAPQLVDRLHRAVRELGPKLPFDVTAPEVEATALDAHHLVLVNHGPESRHVEVHTSVSTLERLTPTGKEPVAHFTVDLAAWDGAILEH